MLVLLFRRWLTKALYKGDLEMLKFPLRHDFKKSLCDHYITIIF